MSSRTSKVFALSLGKGLNTVVALASGMVMARILTQAELATYRQTMLAYQVAIPLLSLGIPSAIYYFLPTEKTRARGLVVDALIMMVTMGLLYAVFIALGGNHLLAKRFSNPAIVNTLAYLVPLPLIMLPAGLLSSVMVVQDQVNKLTIYNVVSHLVLALGIIAACLVWQTPESMVLTRVGISVVTGLIAVSLILKSLPKDDWHPHLGNIKNIVFFSTPLVLAGAVGSISLQLDKLIVSAMCSPEDFAVYSIGALEIPLIGIITGSISNVMVVDFRKAFATGNHSAALALYRLVPKKSTVFLFPVMVYLALVAKPFIVVLFSEKYVASTLPFMLYLLIIPSRTILLGGMAAVGKNKIILRNMLVTLAFNALLSAILVYALGYIGAVIGTVVTLFFWGIPITLYEIARSLNVSMKQVYPWITVFRTMVFALIPAIPTAATLWLLSNNYYLVQLMVTAIVYALTYLIVLSSAGEIVIRRDAARLWARFFRKSG